MFDSLRAGCLSCLKATKRCLTTVGNGIKKVVRWVTTSKPGRLYILPIFQGLANALPAEAFGSVIVKNYAPDLEEIPLPWVLLTFVAYAAIKALLYGRTEYLEATLKAQKESAIEGAASQLVNTARTFKALNDTTLVALFSGSLSIDELQNVLTNSNAHISSFQSTIQTVPTDRIKRQGLVWKMLHGIQEALAWPGMAILITTALEAGNFKTKDEISDLTQPWVLGLAAALGFTVQAIKTVLKSRDSTLKEEEYAATVQEVLTLINIHKEIVGSVIHSLAENSGNNQILNTNLVLGHTISTFEKNCAPHVEYHLPRFARWSPALHALIYGTLRMGLVLFPSYLILGDDLSEHLALIRNVSIGFVATDTAINLFWGLVASKKSEINQLRRYIQEAHKTFHTALMNKKRDEPLTVIIQPNPRSSSKLEPTLRKISQTISGLGKIIDELSIFLLEVEAQSKLKKDWFHSPETSEFQKIKYLVEAGCWASIVGSFYTYSAYKELTEHQQHQEKWVLYLYAAANKSSTYLNLASNPSERRVTVEEVFDEENSASPPSGLHAPGIGVFAPDERAPLLGIQSGIQSSPNLYSEQ